MKMLSPKQVREIRKNQKVFREEEARRHAEDIAVRIIKIGGPIGPKLAERIGTAR